MLDFYTYDKSNEIILNDGYCDFNGNTILLKKRGNINHKYYIYDRKSEKPVIVKDIVPMTIIGVEESSKFKIIFYVDTHYKLSFVKTKKHKFLSEREIIDKVEKSPFVNIKVFNLFQSIIFIGLLRFRTYSYKDVELSLGYNKAQNLKVHFLFPKFLREKFSMNTNKIALLTHIFWSRAPLAHINNQYNIDSNINVPVFIKVINRKFNYYFNLKGNTKDKYNKKHYLFNTRSSRVTRENIEIFVRKSITGQFVLVITSELKNRIKFIESIAYLVSLLHKNKRIYNIYFEKFCEGASESGFELFKQAVKKDKKSVYILDKSNNNYNILKETYSRNIVAKNSFSAFYRIFLANSFISSDLVTHIQRRLYDNDQLLKRKILFNKKKVFLQHGVCLATNVFERGYYNTRVPIAPDFIVVNSEFEKEKFLHYTNYTSNELIKTGLPNLDLYVDSRDKIKDEITFLLTWRPWDLTGKLEKHSYISRYIQFIEMIENNDFYKDKKINIVLHPKSENILKSQFPSIYHKNEKYLYQGDIKEALLKTKVLITDYSSVSFYGFAGGSNVLFFWGDKSLAEKEYGAPNILQKDIAFGDIAYNFEDIHSLVLKNYHNPQKEIYITKYRTLVEYQEGNNTENTYKYLYKEILTQEVGTESYNYVIEN